jgi:hypothetical protein
MAMLPPPGNQCWAALNDKPTRQCKQNSSASGQLYFCKEHRDKLAVNPNWPLAPPYTAYRAELLELLRTDAGEGATGVVPPVSSERIEGAGWLAKLADIKSISAALILTAAFLSEFLFLASFDIDFAFFLATVDAAPLFVRNLSGMMLFSIVVFFALSLLVLVLITVGSLGSGIKNYNERASCLNRGRFQTLKSELCDLQIEAYVAANELQEQEQEQERESARETLRIIRERPEYAHSQTRGVIERLRWFGLRKFGALLVSGSKASSYRERDAADREVTACGVLAQRVKYTRRVEEVDARIHDLKSRIADLQMLIARLQEQLVVAKKKV